LRFLVGTAVVSVAMGIWVLLDPMRKELAKALDLTMDNSMPTAPGAMPVPQRSAVQGF
jgi:hypothetical protein